MEKLLNKTKSAIIISEELKKYLSYLKFENDLNVAMNCNHTKKDFTEETSDNSYVDNNKDDSKTVVDNLCVESDNKDDATASFENTVHKDNTKKLLTKEFPIIIRDFINLVNFINFGDTIVSLVGQLNRYQLPLYYEKKFKLSLETNEIIGHCIIISIISPTKMLLNQEIDVFFEYNIANEAQDIYDRYAYMRDEYEKAYKNTHTQMFKNIADYCAEIADAVNSDDTDLFASEDDEEEYKKNTHGKKCSV